MYKKNIKSIIPFILLIISTNSVRFMAVGDTGVYNARMISVANGMAKYNEKNPVDAILLCGDNIYENGEIEKIR